MSIRSVPKEIKEILVGISKEKSLPYKLIEDVFFHEFEFLAKMMEQGDRDNYSSYENVLLKEFGSFIANEKHINKLEEIRNANQEKDNEICE